MEESKKKKGFLGKMFSVLSGKPTDSEESSLSDSKSKFAPEQKESVDLLFVKKFTASGGKFLYCEKEEEAYDFLGSIISETGVDNIICHNSNLQSILKNAGVVYNQSEAQSNDAYCCGSEFLISFNGGIMISENQTRGKKLKELPDVFIIIAQTSQIVENLRAGLTGIRTKYKGNIPSNITTIKGPENDSTEEVTPSASTCTKDIYLLLLEDQL